MLELGWFEWREEWQTTIVGLGEARLREVGWDWLRVQSRVWGAKRLEHGEYRVQESGGEENKKEQNRMK